MNGRKFAAFDIDGTIFRWQLYHELFDALIEEKVISAPDAKRVLADRERWRKRELEYGMYEKTLMEVMEVAIIGLDDERFHAIADDILLKKGHHVYKFTIDLLRELQKKGYVTIAISASHQQLVERFCQLHDIDVAIGRQFEVKDGKLTDKSNIVHGHKKEFLEAAVAEHGLSLEDSYAVGDSGGDISMLEMVTNPIAFNPNEELLAKAKANNWPIVLERKSIAYRLEKGTDGTYLLAETNL
ncbi:MAG TPA: HAD family phosphatase [Candidatus Saccharibacteria bacterium]|nr:HAD family phosphatase [Candidatus Saccharibacteria bacterium]